MKSRLFNLEFNIFHSWISNLSFHFQSLCIQKDFYFFIPASITYLHLNALLSPPAHLPPQQSLFSSSATTVPFSLFFFFFQPLSECWQSSGFFVLSSCLVRFLWLILPTCSQLLPLISGSYLCVSSPNICLEEYWFFIGAIDLSCRYLRLKVFKADLQKLGDRKLLFLTLQGNSVASKGRNHQERWRI